jgi:hypothetical protein
LAVIMAQVRSTIPSDLQILLPSQIIVAAFLCGSRTGEMLSSITVHVVMVDHFHAITKWS